MIGLAHPAALVAGITVIGVCLTVVVLRTLGLKDTIQFFGLLTALLGIAVIITMFAMWTICDSWMGNC